MSARMSASAGPLPEDAVSEVRLAGEGGGVEAFEFDALPQSCEQGDALAEQDGGDIDLASEQFLGMIASAIFWPRLMHGTRSITPDEQTRAIEEAASTIVARFAAPEPMPPPSTTGKTR